MNRLPAVLSVVVIFVIVMFAGCGQPETPKQTDPEVYKDALVDANEKLVKKEDREIEDYIRRHEWKMQKSGTGLRYLIYQKGEGKKVEKENTVRIRFTVHLINGVEIYNSQTDGEKEFVTGKAEVENGLEEGVMMMRQGDKAKLILPSHLAFGLLGDDNKIPRRATLIYDIEIISVR